MKPQFWLIIILCFSLTAADGQSKDKQQIEKCIINYVDAFYYADSSKAVQSLVRDFAKRGYYRKEGKYVEAKMNFDELKQHTVTWNKDRNIDNSSKKQVTIFEVLDKTASAKVETIWGVDYLHLAKIDGDWKIVNVIWQSLKRN